MCVFVCVCVCVWIHSCKVRRRGVRGWEGVEGNKVSVVPLLLYGCESVVKLPYKSLLCVCTYRT